MLLNIAACAICLGCGPTPGADDHHHPVRAVEPSSNQTAQNQSDDGGPGQEGLYTLRLPAGVAPRSAGGLEVVLRSESPPASEAYRVELFATKPANQEGETSKRFPLGGQDVFKPLSKGQETTIYLSAPPEDAWMQGKTGQELRLGLQIKPLHPKREQPTVSLRIIEAKIAPKQ